MFIVVPIVGISGILCEGCRVYILFTGYLCEDFVEYACVLMDSNCYVNYCFLFACVH